jgi:adenylylsulfate kinase
LNSDHEFSIEDRAENLRRIGEMSKLFIDAGAITLAAFISPFKENVNV